MKLKNKKGTKCNTKKPTYTKPKFKGKDYNDQSWYGKNPQLTIDTANLPFNHNNSQLLDVWDTRDAFSMGIPSVLSLAHDWLLHSVEDITIAARMLWTDIRKHNSGATNYQGMDVIMVIISIADVFINSTWLSSFFGIVKYYNGRNRLIPKVLFSSAGIDYDDFVAHMADYRARFNTLMLRARTLYIPKKYPWIEAAMSFYGKLFKDEDTDTGREQLYIVNKGLFHIFSTSTLTGTKVRPVTLRDMFGDQTAYSRKGAPTGTISDAAITGSAGMIDTPSDELGSIPEQVKFSFYLDVLEKQIDAIMTDEDANIIQGDMMKAFGDTPAYTTGQIDESYEIKPMYSEEFNVYLHNSLIYGSTCQPVAPITWSADETCAYVCAWNTDGMNFDEATNRFGYYHIVNQDPAGNRFGIEINDAGMNEVCTSGLYKNFRPLIDTDKYSPTPEDVIWMTRGYNKDWNNENYIFSNGHIFNAVIWTVSVAQGGSNATVLEAVSAPCFWGASEYAEENYAKVVSLYSMFNWKPIVYKINKLVDNIPRIMIFGDINNPIAPRPNTLRRINDIVLMSLLDIPER